ncbi:hypothetical protein C0995_012946 [Termitomyces sp. Mi166|nr:hypothetical protein C0995_012946 [Termitomyces sp. Mi166\
METSSLLPRALSSGCSTTGTVSCHNTSTVSNLCCFESPGGLMLQTQFWDTNPSTGPTNSWTIHGLWPDQRLTRTVIPPELIQLLTAQGASDTLDFMKTYWVDINGKNEQFWEVKTARVVHARHVYEVYRFSRVVDAFTTRLQSTLMTTCLPSGSPKGAEAVAFFNTVVRLFKSLPTYDWLANAGITPSSSTTHTLSSLNSVLKAGAGVTPALEYAPASGSCPSSGIKYPTKTGTPATTTKTTTSGTTTQTAGGSLPTRATIHAIQSRTLVGGLLTLGTWSTQTLATMTLSGTTSSFTMKSSKGPCGVSGGVFACGSGVTASSFSAAISGSNLLVAYGGSTAFSSTGVPSDTTVYTVYTGSSHAQDYTLSIISA